MKKLLITGANGQLGSDLVLSFERSGYKVIQRTHEELDIADFTEVKEQITRYKPDLLINAAAFHHVDQCESEACKAGLINMVAPGFMARVCRSLSIPFVHFSTDYVFDGKQGSPYTETSCPSPLNIYGMTKMMGEREIMAEGGDNLILRISALYGKQPCRAKNGLNFVQLMLKLAREKGEVRVVDDEFVSPTYTKNIADRLPGLIEQNVRGIVHMTSEGYCSWYEFAKEIFDYTGTPVKLIAAASTDFPVKTKRPKYSVLENSVLKKRRLDNMMHWKDALHAYLDEINEPGEKSYVP